VRQEESRPLVLAFDEWLEENLAKLPAESPVAAAVNYDLNHTDGLLRFHNDGRIELDANIVERTTPVVLSRKNALFADHDDGTKKQA